VFHRFMAIPDAAEDCIPNAFSNKMPTTVFGIANHQIMVNGGVPVILAYGANKAMINAANARYAPGLRFLASANNPVSDNTVSVAKYPIDSNKYTPEGTNGGTLTIAGPSLAPIS